MIDDITAKALTTGLRAAMLAKPVEYQLFKVAMKKMDEVCEAIEDDTVTPEEVHVLLGGIEDADVIAFLIQKLKDLGINIPL